MRSWIEIDTDVRYLNDDSREFFEQEYSGRWPYVANIFERRLAARIRERTYLNLDTHTFSRVIGLAAQLRNSTITLDVEVRDGRVHAEVSDLARYVMPPMTADNASALVFAMGWFALRGLRFRLSVMGDHAFWFPLN